MQTARHHGPAPLLTLLIAAALLGITAHADAADTKRPNIVIFLADDLGWGDLSCYGHPVIRTPHLDAFAKEGVRLTNCYAACSVCSPSRSAILTGRTPYRNGVYRWIPGGSPIHLRTSEITIPSLLKKQGYDTCHVGKWHLNGKFNSPDQPQPNDHGYDHWMATQNNAAPSHKDPVNFVRNGTPVGKLEGFSAPLVADEAVRWLDQRKAAGSDKLPFFLTVWTHEPHLPIESDPQYMDLYQQIEDKDIRQHHGNVTQTDAAFGKLMAALKRLGHDQDTIVFLTSDNGPEGAGDKGRTRGSTGGLRGRKRSTFEGGIRVPGIIRWPGRIPPGSVSDEPVIGSDLFTTLCDIVKIPVPSDRVIDGASLLPLFEGKPVQRDQPLYWRNHLADQRHKVAIRVGDWKLLGSDDLSHFELYNLKDDRNETTELSAKHPDKFKELKEILIRHDKQVLAEGPDWHDAPGGKGAKEDKGRRNDADNKKDKTQPAPDKDTTSRLPGGVDKTGLFDVIAGAVATKGDLGVELAADGEGIALKKLDSPITDKATFTLQYRSLAKGRTRNAMFTFGDSADNASLIKVGSAIGLNAHAAFAGSWDNLGKGERIEGKFDPEATIEAVITIDLKSRSLTARIKDQEITYKLPGTLKQITHYGYYVKGTRTAFSEIQVTR